jgi:hypothetical protein
LGLPDPPTSTGKRNLQNHTHSADGKTRKERNAAHARLRAQIRAIRGRAYGEETAHTELAQLAGARRMRDTTSHISSYSLAGMDLRVRCRGRPPPRGPTGLRGVALSVSAERFTRTPKTRKTRAATRVWSQIFISPLKDPIGREGFLRPSLQSVWTECNDAGDGNQDQIANCQKSGVCGGLR